MWCCLTSMLKDKIYKAMQQKKKKDASAGCGSLIASYKKYWDLKVIYGALMKPVSLCSQEKNEF